MECACTCVIYTLLAYHSLLAPLSSVCFLSKVLLLSLSPYTPLSCSLLSPLRCPLLFFCPLFPHISHHCSSSLLFSLHLRSSSFFFPLHLLFLIFTCSQYGPLPLSLSKSPTPLRYVGLMTLVPTMVLLKA